MLNLFLQFLIRLFFHRPHGIFAGQRTADITALYCAIENSARCHFGTRYIARVASEASSAAHAGTVKSGTNDDLFFGL
jgi:hypothetical protein